MCVCLTLPWSFSEMKWSTRSNSHVITHSSPKRGGESGIGHRAAWWSLALQIALSSWPGLISAVTQVTGVWWRPLEMFAASGTWYVEQNAEKQLEVFLWLSIDSVTSRAGVQQGEHEGELGVERLRMCSSCFSDTGAGNTKEPLTTCFVVEWSCILSPALLCRLEEYLPIAGGWGVQSSSSGSEGEGLRAVLLCRLQEMFLCFLSVVHTKSAYSSLHERGGFCPKWLYRECLQWDEPL